MDEEVQGSRAGEETAKNARASERASHGAGTDGPDSLGAVAHGGDAHGAEWPIAHDVWRRVSPKYAWADLALNLIFVLVVVAALVIVAVTAGAGESLVAIIALAVAAALLVFNALLAFRRVRAIGYVLRDDDLLFRRGILFERVIAVPYGRLQLVDVTRGPLLRSLGLSTLKFVTASAATGVALPGLEQHEAEDLRDRLVDLAESRRSGL